MRHRVHVNGDATRYSLKGGVQEKDFISVNNNMIGAKKNGLDVMGMVVVESMKTTGNVTKSIKLICYVWINIDMVHLSYQGLEEMRLSQAGFLNVTEMTVWTEKR